ncbi:hypothetical protein C0583_04735 [Candidatus Parcubacteria bacterium]|nr:MAG: hypothetical protein C0583_04735 [Candidatus Parcubacteria bacterium]
MYDEYIASSTYWNQGYLYRITSVPSPFSLASNEITLDGNYNIPLIASTSNWNTAYNTVNSKESVWDAKWGSLSDMTLAQGYVYVGNGSANPEATSTIFVSSDGKVGIGTTTPSEALTIDNGGKIELVSADGHNGSINMSTDNYLLFKNAGRYYFGNRGAIYDSGNNVFIGAQNSTSAGVVLGNGGGGYIYLSSATDGGKVGIGTTSPLSKLTVDGNIFLEGASRYINFGATTSVAEAGYGIRDNAGTMQYRDANGTWTSFSSAGTVDGSGATNQITYWSDVDTLTSTSTFTIDASCNISISTTSSAYRVTVGGSLYADDIYTSGSTFYMNGKPIISGGGGTLSLYNQDGYSASLVASTALASDLSWALPTSQGSEGEALILDAAGNFVWGTPSGSGIALTDLSSTATGLVYNDTTGEFSLDSDYNIPLTASTTEWAEAYGWGDHASANYFDLDNAPLSVANGGTGTSTTPMAGYMLIGNASGGYDYISSTSLSGSSASDFLSLSDTPSSYTAGSILFTSASGVTQDSSNLFWDDINNRLGIGTTSPVSALTVKSTGSQLTLAYDDSHYTSFTVDDVGKLIIQAATSTQSAITIGSGLPVDSGLVFDGYVMDMSMGIDNSLGAFVLGTSDTIGSSTVLTILSNGRIGIGTTSPMGSATVTIGGSLYADDIYTSGNTFYMNNQSILSDNGATLSLFNVSGNSASWKASSSLASNLSWYLPVTAGSAGQYLQVDANGQTSWADAATGIDGSGTANQIAYWSDSNTLTSNSNFVIDGSGKVGIGTSTTSSTLTVAGNVDIVLNTVSNSYVLDTTSSDFDSGTHSSTTVVNSGTAGDVQLIEDGVNWTYASSTYVNDAPAGSTAAPSVVDIDGDGDYDIIAGYSDGELSFYRNDGSSTSPSWTTVTHTWLSIDVGSYSRPEFVDIDDDGDYDFFLDGSTSYFYENIGSATSSDWSSSVFSITGSYSFADMDADGDYDLISDANDGKVAYYENVGSATSASWSLVSSNWLSNDFGIRVFPEAADFDGDGDYDLLLGADDGKSYYYKNIGSTSSPSWSYITDTWIADVGANGALTSADMDADGDLDVIFGYDAAALLKYYRNDVKYEESGVFISQTFNVDVYDLQYGILEWTETLPTNTDIQIKLRSASTEGGLSGATWYGPTGTGDYYTTSTGVNINSVHDGDKWIQYQVAFSTSDDTVTPVLSDLTINHTSSSDVFKVSSSTDNSVFRVTGAGNVYAEGSFSGSGADYAEYFYTRDTDLEAGEVVCVDITENNAVERCMDGADTNVMGIVSTRPSIIGNAKSSYEDNENYKVIGMLGQVPARVSTENGIIRPGDSLTSAASNPGYLMRALPGDPTVGVALESFDEGVEIGSYDITISEEVITEVAISADTASSAVEISTSTDVASSTTPESTETQVETINNTESIAIHGGTINVLISRRNKSLTVDMVENKITERIADMEIEDEVEILIANAVDSLSLDDEITPIINEELALFNQGLDSRLDVEFNEVDNQLLTLSSSMDDVLGRLVSLETSVDSINSNINTLETGLASVEAELASFSMPSVSSTTVLSASIEVTDDGGVRMGDIKRTRTSTSSDVAVVEIVSATTSLKTAFVVNQEGSADIADFQADGVSVVSIAETGKVSVVGEMMVDGRIMICSGGACGSALDNAVDESMGDMGVEGKVVAGAFESYCDDGFTWAPGSSKYGTMPGFCVQIDEASIEFAEENDAWVNINQGEASLACQELGSDYHLLTENEWLTIAENAIRVIENDIDRDLDGLQLAIASSSEATSSNYLYFSNGSIL